MIVRKAERVLDQVHLHQGNIGSFAAEVGLRGLQVVLNRGRIPNRTVVEVGLSDSTVEMTVNARTVFAHLPRFKGSRLSAEQAAEWLDREVKAQLFWVAVSQKWHDVKERGLPALWGAFNASGVALAFLHDEDQRVVTARKSRSLPY